MSPKKLSPSVVARHARSSFKEQRSESGSWRIGVTIRDVLGQKVRVAKKIEICGYGVGVADKGGRERWSRSFEPAPGCLRIQQSFTDFLWNP